MKNEETTDTPSACKKHDRKAFSPPTLTRHAALLEATGTVIGSP